MADWLNERPVAVELLNRLLLNRLLISIITYGEIDEGIVFGRDPLRAAAVFQQVLRGVRVLPLSRATVRRFAVLRGTLRAQGQLIGDMDLLIAATALQHARVLVTRNRRHFERIPELMLH